MAVVTKKAATDSATDWAQGGIAAVVAPEDSFEDHVRDTLASFRELTYFFYRFNHRPDEWWARARELVATTALPQAASDREAFLAFATGFAAEGGVWREPGSFFDPDFFNELYTRFVPAATQEASDRPQVTLDAIIRLRATPTLTPSAVPLEGKGRLASSIRVEVNDTAPGDANRIRRMHIPDAMGSLFSLMDGRRTLRQLGDAYQEQQEINQSHRSSLERYILWIGQSLVDRDLATITMDS